jgi:DNA-binding GntR family transcriptional regulator
VSEDAATLEAAPLRVSTKAEAVYTELRERILDGSLEPGSTLNQEALAGTLGLSITPLREALRRLEGDGMVRLEAHRTMTVMPLTRRELEELYTVRLHLDPLAASLAATNATAEQIKEIGRLASLGPADTPRRQLEANRNFHRAVYSASNNLVLTDVLDRLWNRTDRYRLIVLRERIHERVAGKEHREIAAAVRARQADLVARLVRDHVGTTKQLIEQLAHVL